MDNKTALERTIALCEQATNEKNAGNPSLLKRIGGNGGLQTFYANAFSIHSVQYSQFSKQFPSQWAEIVGFWEAVDKEEEIAEAAAAKVDSIESRLEKLETLLTSFIESQKPAPVADEKPAKKASKKAAKADEPVTEETIEADAESEA